MKHKHKKICELCGEKLKNNEDTATYYCIKCMKEPNKKC